MTIDPEFPLATLISLGLLSACAETKCYMCDQKAHACYTHEVFGHTLSNYPICSQACLIHFINSLLDAAMYLTAEN